MKDFLDFTNTASQEELTQLSGIGAALADQIIASRPFESLDDLLKVRGMGQKLLSSLQVSYRERLALVPVEDEAPVAVTKEEPVRARPPQPEPGPSFGQRFGRALLVFFRGLLRLLILVIVLGAIGAAVYFGIPYLYETYVRPVENNAARISQVATQQATDLEQMNLELVILKSQLEELQGRVDSAERNIAAYSKTITQLQDMQATLDSALDSNQAALRSELEYQIKLVHAIELLSRSRLYLSQSNFGMAREDVLASRELLAELQAVAPPEQQDGMAIVIARLDLALSNLPGFPVIAANDVDIAWQLLIADLPADAAPLDVPTPTPTPFDVTGTPEATFTPTP